MSTFNFFIDRAESYSVAGKSNELIFCTRKGRSETASSMNNERIALLQDNTSITNADLVTNITTNISYLVVGRESSNEANHAQLRKINATGVIVRIIAKYVNGTKVGDQEQSLFSNVPLSEATVSGNAKLYDAGILQNTVKKFIMQNLEIKLLDRIKVNGNNYQIDAVDNTKYEGLLEVQCSIDNRKTV